MNIIHTNLFDVNSVLQNNQADFVLSLQTMDISSGVSSNVAGDIQIMFVAYSKHHLVNESLINGQYLSS